MRAGKTAEVRKGTLQAIGVGDERLVMCFPSVAMGPRSAEITTEVASGILTPAASSDGAARRLAEPVATAGAS